jgi:hypothetical protein
MADDKPLPPPVRIDPEDLPVWLSDQWQHRATWGLLCATWWAIKEYAEVYKDRGVAIVDRQTAEERGNWPPRNLIRYREQDYWLGEIDATCTHPRLQARLEQDPRVVRVCVSMRGVQGGAPNSVIAGEYLAHLDHEPSGVWLAGSGNS